MICAKPCGICYVGEYGFHHTQATSAQLVINQILVTFAVDRTVAVVCKFDGLVQSTFPFVNGTFDLSWLNVDGVRIVKSRDKKNHTAVRANAMECKGIAR